MVQEIIPSSLGSLKCYIFPEFNCMLTVTAVCTFIKQFKVQYVLSGVLVKFLKDGSKSSDCYLTPRGQS